MNAKLSPVELERRKPVWSALSDFWLDNELDEQDENRIARVLLQSRYSMAEIEHMLWHEVAPVVFLNCYVATGAWGLFDDDWLHPQTKKRAESNGWVVRTLLNLGFGQKIMGMASPESWKKVQALIKLSDSDY